MILTKTQCLQDILQTPRTGRPNLSGPVQTQPINSYRRPPIAFRSPLRPPLRIPLTQGQFAVVDAEDYPRLAGYEWTACPSGNTCYAKTHTGGLTIYMHRLIVLGRTGLHKRIKVDHSNGDGLDNRRANLRPVTHAQNMMNSLGRPNVRKSKYKGVSVRNHDRKPFRATIEFEGRQHHLGYFSSEIAAACAYDAGARFYFGPHARLNFPGESHDQHAIPAERTRSFVALIPSPGPTASYTALPN
jgi:hypothetical protein